MSPTSPNQPLMRSRQNLDRLGARRISGDPPMVLPVGSNHVGQDLGITWIGFRTGGDVAISTATGGEGIDGEELVPSRHQAFDQQASIGFDTDNHLSCIGLQVDRARSDLLVGLRSHR
jgi:hypothetical protein